jgi:hypothetical protein
LMLTTMMTSLETILSDPPQSTLRIDTSPDNGNSFPKSQSSAVRFTINLVPETKAF